MTRQVLALGLTTVAGLLLGCGRPLAAATQPTEGTTGYPVKLLEPPRKIAFSDYPVAPKPAVTPEFQARGKALYEKNCVMCHGLAGDGQGEVAGSLLLRPRNFQTAHYRLRSTPTGQLPTDADLFRAISLGLPGSMMPPWRYILTEAERWAVAEYVKSFSDRFRDTTELRTILDLGNSPSKRAAALAGEGSQLYLKMGCVTCHGESGRGDGPSASALTDDSEQPIKPRDFTQRTKFKSGYSTRDKVRAILTGLDGTPMAGFSGALKPEEAWKLAYYLETLAEPACPAGPVSDQPKNGQRENSSCLR